MATVDTDLEEMMSHLGEFGRYQAWQYSLHVIAGLTAGLHMLTLLTVAAVPQHKCVVPGLRGALTTDNLKWQDVPLPHERLSLQENASWSQMDIPISVDTCHYLDPEDNVTKNCQEWVYDTTYYKSSRGMEWNFVCSQRWMGAVAQSSYMFGVFAGAVTLGTMADKYGRKIIFCLSGTAQLVLGVLVAFVPEYYSFLVVRFFYGVFGSAGAYITGFVLTMELVGASKRTVCGMMFQLAFACGFLVVAAWGALISDRMWLQIVYGLHGALLVGHWWLMDESPRWLWAQGRAVEAVEIVERALKMNRNTVELDKAKYVSRNKARHASRDQTVSYGAGDLFKTPNLRKKSLNVCLNWFANSIVYYGLSLSSGSLIDGNPYLVLFLTGLVEIPSYVLASLTMDRVGRRCLVSTFMLIGGVCCITATSIPRDLSGAVIVIVLFGKSCIAISFAVIYNYTAELFPTVLRNTALGIGSMCARLSGALTPLIMLLDSLNPRIPATTFGFIAVVSGFLSLYLPETAGHPMPETLEDGEKFGQGDTCFTTCLGGARKQRRTYDIALKQVDGGLMNDADNKNNGVPMVDKNSENA
ncbi:organic cation transporter protein [Venturia canescens]|uniref:organic cation transporter protein n=1 Tax=Venturia canescens TaxID=32260 RepID=UPI001C9D515B|nr:organic cation transporter protein [Venturia canescens]XP_043289828.1 organic cation transporter protein [Venturia canescens]XP_043289829.1 organic cation transporter protein [Venturia canescens]